MWKILASPNSGLHFEGPCRNDPNFLGRLNYFEKFQNVFPAFASHRNREGRANARCGFAKRFEENPRRPPCEKTEGLN